MQISPAKPDVCLSNPPLSSFVENKGGSYKYLRKLSKERRHLFRFYGYGAITRAVYSNISLFFTVIVQ